MLSPTAANRTTRRGLSGLTGKGHAAVLLIRVRDGWATLSPSQRHEVDELLERLSMAMRAAKIASSVPAAGAVPRVGRLSA